MAAEKRLQDWCVKTMLRMRREGEPIYWIKTISQGKQRAGLPDLHVTYHGVSLWLELKSPAGRASLLQKAELEKWRSAGSVAALIRTREDFSEALARARVLAGPLT